LGIVTKSLTDFEEDLA